MADVLRKKQGVATLFEIKHRLKHQNAKKTIPKTTLEKCDSGGVVDWVAWGVGHWGHDARGHTLL